MKISIFIFFLLIITGCSKDNDSNSNCETVFNPNGPAYIKVINNRSETVQVYFGDFNLSIGAQLRSGVCEIYGVPVKNRAVEISTLDGTKSKDIFVDAKEGETTTITVGADFF